MAKKIFWGLSFVLVVAVLYGFGMFDRIITDFGALWLKSVPQAEVYVPSGLQNPLAPPTPQALIPVVPLAGPILGGNIPENYTPVPKTTTKPFLNIPILGSKTITGITRIQASKIWGTYQKIGAYGAINLTMVDQEKSNFPGIGFLIDRDVSLTVKALCQVVSRSENLPPNLPVGEIVLSTESDESGNVKVNSIGGTVYLAEPTMQLDASIPYWDCNTLPTTMDVKVNSGILQNAFNPSGITASIQQHLISSSNEARRFARSKGIVELAKKTLEEGYRVDLLNILNQMKTEKGGGYANVQNATYNLKVNWVPAQLPATDVGY